MVCEVRQSKEGLRLGKRLVVIMTVKRRMISVDLCNNPRD